MVCGPMGRGPRAEGHEGHEGRSSRCNKAFAGREGGVGRGFAGGSERWKRVESERFGLMSLGAAGIPAAASQIVTPFLAQFTVMRAETRLSADGHAAHQFQAGPGRPWA
jgi:hypothetical protein